MVNLFSPIGAKLGWEPLPTDSDLTKSLRALVMGRLVSHGDATAVSEALVRFQRLLVDRKSTPLDLQSILFRAAMRAQPDKAFPEIVNLYKTGTTPEEKIKAIVGLSSANDRATAERYDSPSTLPLFLLLFPLPSLNPLLAWLPTPSPLRSALRIFTMSSPPSTAPRMDVWSAGRPSRLACTSHLIPRPEVRSGQAM